MVTRNNVIPNPLGIVDIQTKNGRLYSARHVEGIKSYDGWYIPEERRLVPQKELQVTHFVKNGEWMEYIPKDILDIVFGNRYQLDSITFDTRVIMAKAGMLIPKEEWL